MLDELNKNSIQQLFGQITSSGLPAPPGPHLLQGYQFLFSPLNYNDARHPCAAVLILQVHSDPEPLEPAGADPVAQAISL